MIDAQDSSESGNHNTQEQSPQPRNQHCYAAYYTDPHAANVLARMEAGMMEGQTPTDQLKHLRALLEAECKAQVCLFTYS